MPKSHHDPFIAALQGLLADAEQLRREIREHRLQVKKDFDGHFRRLRKVRAQLADATKSRTKH